MAVGVLVYYVTLINTNKMLSLKMVEKKDEEKYQNRPEM